MRNAEQQWQAAGAESVIKATWPADTDAVIVDGRGGPCLMCWDEWDAYRQLCAAPTISMRQVDAEAEAEAEANLRWAVTPSVDDLARIHESLETALIEVKELITQAEARLALCVRCVAELRGGAQ